MKQAILRLARRVLNIGRLASGMLVYRVTGRTPAYAYQAMIALFCATRGKSNDLISKLIGSIRRPWRLPRADGVLGTMTTPADREKIVSQLRSRGYYVMERGLPDEMAERLLTFALTQPCLARAMDGQTPGAVVRAAYPREAPGAVRYDFATADLLANEDVQKLLADLSLLAIAQDYLGARPHADVLTMWWHTAFSDVPDSEAAQFFHFDMDRPKWLKVFIYLTDVGSRNGPHAFVAGSHRSGAIPAHLLDKGYVRLSDAEVEQAFPSSDVLQFSAPRGSIILEDTRGLHKGRHVESGDRLVLQLQFSNSLFGGSYPAAKIPGSVCQELRDRIQRYPELYSAYLP